MSRESSASERVQSPNCPLVNPLGYPWQSYTLFPRIELLHIATEERPSMTVTPDPVRPFLRHSVATVAYRAAKALRGAPESFAEFQSGESTRAPSKILAHMGDLFDWALSMARGQTAWLDSEPLPCNQEVQRFFATLQAFDDFLASGEPLHAPAEKIFHGAVAHPLTHVEQLPHLP